MQTLLQDLRFAVRQIRRSPGFAITAVLILALGIAANVIVFGLLQALILRPLDVPHPDRVMTLARKDLRIPVFSYPEVRDVRDDNTVFSAVAAFGLGNFGLEANGVARPVSGYYVSGQYFEVVAIKPFLGRLLQRADDDHPGASEAAVLSWPAWKSYFGADPNIVGKTVRINKHPYTIVGVTPEGFYGTEKFLQPDIFLPLANEASLSGTDFLELRGNNIVESIVRIKDGVTRAQVQANLDSIAARLKRQYPKEEEKLGFRLSRPGLLGDYGSREMRGLLAGLMGLTTVRIDKWLWASRFFKSRALAARACELGRVQSNHQAAKPARDVRVGDLLHIKTDSGEFEVKVMLLSEVRGPASIAQTLYAETESGRELRLKLAAERKATMNFTPAPEGRPSKRDRRRIIQFRGGNS